MEPVRGPKRQELHKSRRRQAELEDKSARIAAILAQVLPLIRPPLPSAAVGPKPRGVPPGAATAGRLAASGDAAAALLQHPETLRWFR
jgi:hypothetical protein